jgi:outer membrane lipoprotein SlyB
MKSMSKFLATIAFAYAVTLCGCAKTDATASADRPIATVVMRDGTRVKGTLVASSGTEITIAGDDGKTQSIPMKQVRRVDYEDAPVPPPAAAASAPASAAPTPAIPSPAATDAVHEDHYHPVKAAIQTRTYTVRAGTDISVRTEETIDSAVAVPGQTYPAEVTRDVLDADGAVVVPRGSNAQIVIRSASKGGRVRGKSDLVVDLDSVSVDGQMYSLSTQDLAQVGKDGVGANKRTAKYSGGGAAIGAIIGAIAGGGKGAAIGAGAGAGAGAVTQIATKGGSIRIPVESVLTFRLDANLRVVAAQ